MAGGSFDDPGWITIERHTWTRSKHHWVPLPEDVETFEQAALSRPSS